MSTSVFYREVQVYKKYRAEGLQNMVFVSRWSHIPVLYIVYSYYLLNVINILFLKAQTHGLVQEWKHVGQDAGWTLARSMRVIPKGDGKNKIVSAAFHCALTAFCWCEQENALNDEPKFCVKYISLATGVYANNNACLKSLL